MDKLKTDGDIMVYLRNIRDNLEKIAEKTGQEIHLYVNGKDYGSVETGGYIAIKVNGRESYQYRLDEVRTGDMWSRIRSHLKRGKEHDI